MTKKQYAIVSAWLKSELVTLQQCYERPSKDKETAYMACRNRFFEQKGIYFYIISYNTFMFTVGWEFLKDDKWYFHYESNKTIKEWLVD